MLGKGEPVGEVDGQGIEDLGPTDGAGAGVTAAVGGDVTGDQA